VRHNYSFLSYMSLESSGINNWIVNIGIGSAGLGPAFSNALSMLVDSL
jgi:hypothetical protein